jgi:ubiquinone/menaquinone biosynthesis C-methylase UbiE
MLRQARARLGDAAWLIGGAATALPIASERIDTLVSTNTLHFAPSVKTALAEWWRVLKPGGRCVIVDWCGDGWSVKWMSRWLRLMGRAGQAPLTQRGLRERLAEIGFEPGNVSTLRVNWLWRVMQVVARKPA